MVKWKRAMAWIYQTKQASRKSGGPQYYLQDLNEHTRAELRRRQRCPVRLWSPYGIVESGLTAVSNAVGSVGHDRIQSGRRGVASVADQVAHWFGLNRADIDRIDFDESFDNDNVFVMLPTHVTFRGGLRPKTL